MNWSKNEETPQMSTYQRIDDNDTQVMTKQAL